MKIKSLFLPSFIVIISILILLLLQTSHIPIDGKKVTLGDETYDIVPLNAPIATSNLLLVFSYLLTKSFIGPHLVRILLNDNKVHLLRELASQIKLPPAFYPLKRVNAADSKEFDYKLQEDLLSGKVSLTSTKVINQRTISDYAKAYRSGTKPSEVIKKIITQVYEWENQSFPIFSMINQEEVLKQVVESDKRFLAGNIINK